MRRVRYVVAMSLDGYIAGPNGEADWIIMDPEIDFQALFEQFDVFLLGRKTFESRGGTGGGRQSGVQTLVFSQTLRQQDYPNVTIVSDNPQQVLADLRSKSGKDIYLALRRRFALPQSPGGSVSGRSRGFRDARFARGGHPTVATQVLLGAVQVELG